MPGERALFAKLKDIGYEVPKITKKNEEGERSRLLRDQAFGGGREYTYLASQVFTAICTQSHTSRAVSSVAYKSQSKVLLSSLAGVLYQSVMPVAIHNHLERQQPRRFKELTSRLRSGVVSRSLLYPRIDLVRTCSV